MRINKKQTGFALLMTLIVVSVVISIGLSILDLTIKQLKLSTDSKDSEIALHAANAGLECAEYWRNFVTTPPANPDIESGAPFPITCFGVTDAETKTAVAFTAPAPAVTANDDVQKYVYEFSWGTPVNRCTRVTMVLFTSDNSSGGVNVTEAEMIAQVPGYPKQAGNPPKFCEPGGRCTVTSVQGYNRTCTNTDLHGTIQREVLLES